MSDYHALMTAGYGKCTIDEFTAIVTRELATVADIRLKPWSEKPGFKSDELRARFGGVYVHVPELGNVGYRGGAIEIADFDAGAERLRELLAVRPVVLLCGCAQIQSCHRRVVAERMGMPWREITDIVSEDELTLFGRVA